MTETDARLLRDIVELRDRTILTANDLEPRRRRRTLSNTLRRELWRYEQQEQCESIREQAADSEQRRMP